MANDIFADPPSAGPTTVTANADLNDGAGNPIGSRLPTGGGATERAIRTAGESGRLGASPAEMIVAVAGAAAIQAVTTTRRMVAVTIHNAAGGATPMAFLQFGPGPYLPGFGVRLVGEGASFVATEEAAQAALGIEIAAGSAGGVAVGVTTVDW
jgi:hypothetical protein